MDGSDISNKFEHDSFVNYINEQINILAAYTKTSSDDIFRTYTLLNNKFENHRFDKILCRERKNNPNFDIKNLFKETSIDETIAYTRRLSERSFNFISNYFYRYNQLPQFKSYSMPSVLPSGTFSLN